jgi:hypothetical protein
MFHLIFNYNPAMRGFAMFDQVKVGGTEEEFHGFILTLRQAQCGARALREAHL